MSTASRRKEADEEEKPFSFLAHRYWVRRVREAVLVFSTWTEVALPCFPFSKPPRRSRTAQRTGRGRSESEHVHSEISQEIGVRHGLVQMLRPLRPRLDHREH